MLVDANPEQLDTMLYLVSVGLLKIEIQDIYSLLDAAQSHKQIESGHTRGKLLFDMKC